uniref:40S ribosomal protein S19 n=1 Tax=Phaeomonas parva TaxID=124430 RepID=A0A6U4HGD5_9STRA|mmetsp:Transcript_35231/g.110920  ORF Transcript_35231/g.110920 Transcript_35231/m.110920 type:complete len:147 (+) Transcript_35231:625-1065(+)
MRKAWVRLPGGGHGHCCPSSSSQPDQYQYPHPILSHPITGPHKELAPNDPDWYFIRCASIARRVYLRPGCGIGNLRDWYGGSKSRGVRPQHHSKASAGIIRACLKQLEEMRIVEKCGKSGRRVSQVVGRREMDTIAGQVARGEDEA